MSMSDTLADMLTRIRNAQKSRLTGVSIPFSKEKAAVLDVLKEEGFVDSYSVVEVKKNIKQIDLALKYSLKGESNIKMIERISKPGKRVYKSIKDLKPCYNGMGIYVISTSKGIISDRNAHQFGVGGEVICKIF